MWSLPMAVDHMKNTVSGHKICHIPAKVRAHDETDGAVSPCVPCHLKCQMRIWLIDHKITETQCFNNTKRPIAV